MAAGAAAGGAISIGVGHDVSWDAATAARGVPVWMFDPTVDGPPRPVPGARFLPIGLGDPARTPPGLEGCDLRPLDAIVEATGLREREDLILKIDVEGSEWAALRDADVGRFEQVLIEMHDLDRLADEARSVDVLATSSLLYATHYPVHIHANNERPFHRFDGIWFPEVVEVSYLRRDLLRSAMPADALATHLDRPTNPRYPDYDLSGLLSAAV
jgi:hypothetical protein